MTTEQLRSWLWSPDTRFTFYTMFTFLKSSPARCVIGYRAPGTFVSPLGHEVSFPHWKSSAGSWPCCWRSSVPSPNNGNSSELRVLKWQLWPYANRLIWLKSFCSFINIRCFTWVLSSGRSRVFNISSTQLLPPPVSTRVSTLPVTRELNSFLRSWKRW